MDIATAQQEMRHRFVGGFYGQLVSGLLWLGSAGLTTWHSPRAGILLLVIGGFFIFPMTEALLRLIERPSPLSRDNALQGLGMQVAFVLPLSMPVLVPVAAHRLELFFPAMTVLVGAHYAPFVFLYGMRLFGVLTAVLVTGGVLIARWPGAGLPTAAWFTGAVLLAFAVAGRQTVR